MNKPPNTDTFRPRTIMDVTDFGFLTIVAPEWAAEIYNTLVAAVSPKAEQRLFTGYAPEAERRDVRHRRHCDGFHFEHRAVGS